MSVDEPDEPMVPSGCLAMFVSVAFAALLITLGAAPGFGGSLFLYVPIFIVTTIIASTIALPLRHVAAHFRFANAWTAAAIGMVTGGGLPALSAFSDSWDEGWIGVATYGLIGAMSGLIFFLIEAAPRARRRNLVVIAALAAISIAVALFIRPPPPRPEDSQTIAAFEVPLLTGAERQAFLQLLRSEAQANGFHLDAASADELQSLSEVSPITMNACIWRGNDVEIVVCAMDGHDHIGKIWLTFSRGEDPPAFADFRAGLMPKIVHRWPQTLSLPIMPTGTIPLAEDLMRTPSGYAVAPAAWAKYQLKASAAR